MSKVKFIQLTATTTEDYKSKIEQTLQSYPGAIIFVANNGAGKQEIWANGLKYEVGGGGTGNVIYGDKPVNANGIAEGYTGSEGSIYVYVNETTQTAYYWKDGKWEPFNVDAENVWFHEDITLAGDYTQIGNFTKPETGTAKIKTILGKVGQDFNLQDLITGLLSKAIASGAQFSVTLSPNQKAVGQLIIKNGNNNVSNNAQFEVGTNLSVSAQLKTASAVKQKLTANTSTYGYKTTPSGSLIMANYTQEKTPTISGNDECTLKKGDAVYSATTFEVTNGTTTFKAETTSAAYTGVKFDTVTIIPVNNLSEEEASITPTSTQLNQYEGQTLTPGADSPTLNIKGYWPYFYGSLSSCPTNWVQANLGSTKSQSFTSKEYKIPSGSKVAFVAIPEANSSKTISINNSATTAAFSTEVQTQQVNVTLGTQTQVYTVFYLAAASATGSDANFKITIS